MDRQTTAKTYTTLPPKPAAPYASNGSDPLDLDIPDIVPGRGLNPVSLLMAVRGLGANKLRAFLTMLGVIIGVGAVIIAIAIGQGSREAVAQSLRTLGTNTLNVMAGAQRRGGIGFGFGSRSTLKPADADAILMACPSVIRVCPQVQGNSQVKYGDKNDSVSVYGQGQDYPVINNHRIRAGRFFDKADLKARRRVAVLGSTTATDLFDEQSPVGKSVRVAGQRFEVIGVFQSKGGTGFRNPDSGVYVPYTTAMRRLFGQTSLQGITCQAASDSVMKRAQEEITELLRKQHHIADGAEDDFLVFNQADLAAAQNEQQDTFSALITYLAIVSLVVGGVGIMNIMLVSVTERTREIGVRKAIGAKRRHILTQFLLEALFLSLIGGLLGVAFGIGGAKLVQAVNNWTVVIAMRTVLMAFSFSAMVGAFFGFYPAWKASRLSPIDALRYE
ncbi:MAG TPA: ABC transporter permease [Armatimonadota bacterium]|jgi:putative ABC transport system permease protein